LSEQPINRPVRERDDFVIVQRAPVTGILSARPGAVVIMGPGLATEGVAFVTTEAAIARGKEIAQRCQVSLWDATAPGDPVLITTFRR
jgi:hypothetical protein